MIVNCLAVPYRKMEEYKFRMEKSELGQMLQRYARVWVISITDPASPPLFLEMSNVLPLQFHDVDADRYDPQAITILPSGEWLQDPEAPRTETPQIVPFTSEMAAAVVQFVMRAHNDPEDCSDVLVVNCMAGVSRSGAVADFARVACRVPFESFAKSNRHIVPNPYVRRLLFEALGLWQAPESE